MNLTILLWGIPQAMRVAATVYPDYAARLKEKNLVVQFRLRDKPEGRWIKIDNGKITSGRGIHTAPDLVVEFKNRALAERFLTPPFNLLERVDAAKNFKVRLQGSDELAVWFLGVMGRLESITWKAGMDMGNGVTRYTSGTNGGPIFVYVKDGKILRTTPIDFTDEDAPSWSINARGKTFTPPTEDDARRARHVPEVDGVFEEPAALPDEARRLRPQRRAQHPESRQVRVRAHQLGRSARHGGERDQARQGHRPRRHRGATTARITSGATSGTTSLPSTVSGTSSAPRSSCTTPDSWEGWFWGAMHHWGNSLRLGCPEFYGTVEDCLKEAEMIVFWSSDPDTTYGFEGTQRREWANQLGIKMVHIDPHLNHTAAHVGGKWIAPKPGTDPALAQAICHVWITEGLYDKEFVADRTTGFDEWKAYVLGESDGVPKTPEWQEAETGVPARDVRALAREWGSKKTYLGAGSWAAAWWRLPHRDGHAVGAHAMILPDGDAGLGPPGVNFGNLQFGTPLDFNFYFPGYAEGRHLGRADQTAPRRTTTAHAAHA
jgi:hypothetical protein